MAIRKAVDNERARDEARSEIVKAIHDANVGVHEATALDIANVLIDRFPAAQFEETTSKAAGEDVTLWRLVLTGQWNVQR